MGNLGFRTLTLEAGMCSKVSLSLKRHLPNRLRQRDKRVRSEIKEIGQQLIKSAHSKCERDCHSVILSRHTGAVRQPLIRARHHILWRLKDANEKHAQSITKFKKSLFVQRFLNTAIGMYQLIKLLMYAISV